MPHCSHSLKLEQVLNDDAGRCPKPIASARPQVLDLLDHIGQVQLVEASGAEQRRLSLGSDLKVLIEIT
jgi:hypothetical protein